MVSGPRGAPVVARGAGGVGQQPGHLVGIRQQSLARLGQRDAAAVPLEQRAADVRLERLDAGGDVGLDGVQLGGGPVHAAEPGDRLEHLQVGGVHLMPPWGI